MEEPLTLRDLQYDLPEELIAQEPLPERTASRLLRVRRSDGTIGDGRFTDLPGILRPGDLLVLNDTRVHRARLRGRRAGTGGKVEMLLLRRLSPGTWRVLLRPGKRARKGELMHMDGGLECSVRRRLAPGRAEVSFSMPGGGDPEEVLSDAAEVPLPPYIRRVPGELDDERYQTVYAASSGAVAAPTAGLHFDGRMLDTLAGMGIGMERVTLHVGPGTFEPLRREVVAENRLEAEEYVLPDRTAAAVAETRSRGGRVVAVGTTVCRVLESVADPDSGRGSSGETSLFIFPPHDFRVVDVLLTNFHLPGSSLLALVAAFAGLELTGRAYSHAVDSRYRFYSYGDAMIIE